MQNSLCNALENLRKYISCLSQFLYMEKPSALRYMDIINLNTLGRGQLKYVITGDIGDEGSPNFQHTL